jgi:hypothetical protein
MKTEEEIEKQYERARKEAGDPEFGPKDREYYRGYQAALAWVMK